MRVGQKSRRALGLILCATLILALSIPANAQRPAPKKRIVLGDTLYTLLKPGDIPGIFEPEFMSAKEAAELAFVEDTTHPEGGESLPWYFDVEPMMVVVGKTEVKAYSAWHLDGHEIVNDYIDGGAITVTW